MGQPEAITTAYYGNGNNGGETASANTRAKVPYRIRHRGVFIGLISTIFIMCLTHLALGIFVSIVVDPADTYVDSGTHLYYTQDSIVSRV